MRLVRFVHRSMLAWCVLAAFSGVEWSHAETVTLDKPAAVSGKKINDAKFSGRVISYDDAGFTLRLKADKTETIAWDDLDAKSRYVVWKNLIGPKDARAHLELGRKLIGLEGGKDWAEKAFTVALKLEPGFKRRIEEIRKNPPATQAATTQPGAADDAAPEGEMSGADNGGPKVVGGVDAEFWKPQTPEQQAAAVAKLKAFADETQKTMGKPLRLNETSYFLFYSDISEQEARNWSGLLDRMYAKLTEMFAVTDVPSIWRGKALVFVFQKSTDYIRFQALMHRTDASQTAGMCHSYGDGMVHIAFFRQSQELEFAHVLVHESVHGFLHRYKTPVNVPSWINEGLAEWIANTLVPRPNRAKSVLGLAQSQVRLHRGVGTFFEAEHIEGWHYPVAEMLTTFMIERNKSGYVAFIEGVKNGMPWEESLKTHYQTTRQKLLQDFGKSIGV